MVESITVLGPNDLVLCSGSLMQRGFRALCEAGAAGEFAGITLWPQDVEAARAEGLSEADQRALLRDSGLVVADLDPLLGWLAGAAVLRSTAQAPRIGVSCRTPRMRPREGPR